MSQAPDPPDALVGAVVAGRYHVVRRVAAGGMGVVYEARQEPLGRRVALKVIRGDVNDPVTRLRFEREARAASALQDAHVVVVHDFGVIEDGVAAGGLFLAMEYVEGTTLRAKLGAAGRLPWERSRPLIRQIAQALAAAHARQLVHRDLKPENVMLVDVGSGMPVCKVLDFGLAKGTGHDALLRAGSDPLTHSGGFVGTPGYISPEVIDGAADDPRQDVYALGIVWWELLTGRHPFPAETPMKTLVRQMHEDAPVVDPTLRSTDNIPPGGAELLRDMMARDPQQRPKDASAVLWRLDTLEHDTIPDRGSTPPASSPPSSAVSSASSPLPRWPDRQEAMTVDGRPHRQANHSSNHDTQTSFTPPPSSSSSLPSSSSAVTAQALPGARRRRRRAAWLLAVGAAAGIGAGITLVFEHTVDTVTRPPETVVVVDAGAVEVVEVSDAGVLSTELVMNGVPSFAVFKLLREHLPPHTLRLYRHNLGEVVFAGDIASAVADAVQDLEIEHEGRQYTIEVGDLIGGRVVATMSAPEALVLEDAGVDIAPGGLEP